MRVPFSFFLLIALVLDGAWSFSPQPRPVARAIVSSMARFSPEEDKTNDSTKTEEDAVATALESKGLTPIQQIFMEVTSFTSYILMMFTAAVSFGLLLNTVGYAYQFSWDHGLEIETIGKMRDINQFRAEVNHRPPSVLPK